MNDDYERFWFHVGIIVGLCIAIVLVMGMTMVKFYT